MSIHRSAPRDAPQTSTPENLSCSLLIINVVIPAMHANAPHHVETKENDKGKTSQM
jgi:hypothetical protein